MKKDKNLNRISIRLWSKDMIATMLNNLPFEFYDRLQNERDFRHAVDYAYIYKEKQFQFMLEWISHKKFDAHWKKVPGLVM